jgi:hypothetical protein
MQDIQGLFRQGIGGRRCLLGFARIHFLLGIGLGNRVGPILGKRKAARPSTRQDGQPGRYNDNE